jgi:hypothetical protein
MQFSVKVTVTTCFLVSAALLACSASEVVTKQCGSYVTQSGLTLLVSQHNSGAISDYYYTLNLCKDKQCDPIVHFSRSFGPILKEDGAMMHISFFGGDVIYLGNRQENIRQNILVTSEPIPALGSARKKIADDVIATRNWNSCAPGSITFPRGKGI